MSTEAPWLDSPEVATADEPWKNAPLAEANTAAPWEAAPLAEYGPTNKTDGILQAADEFLRSPAVKASENLGQFLSPKMTLLNADPSVNINDAIGQMDADKSERGDPLNRPIFRIPYLSPEHEKAIGTVPAVASRFAVDTANFFQSPLGIGTLGLSASNPIIGKVIGGLFTAKAIKDAPDVIQQVRDAKTPEEKKAAYTSALEDGLMMLPALGALRGKGGEVRPAGLTPEQINRATTQAQLNDLAPKAADVVEPKTRAEDETVDGWLVADRALKKDFADQPPEVQAARQNILDALNEQMLNVPGEQIKERAAELAKKPEQPEAPSPESSPEATANPQGEIPSAEATTAESIAPLTTEVAAAASGTRVDPLEQLRQLQQDAGLSSASAEVPEGATAVDGSATPPVNTYDPDTVSAHASSLPEDAGTVVTGVINDGMSVEDAAAKVGWSVARAQKAVDASKAYLDKAKTAVSKETPSPFGRDEVSTEARPDSPEAEAIKDWTSATQDRTEGRRMKRGGGESGSIEIPKFADRKMSELDAATTERSAKLQKSFEEAERAKKEIEKAIPSQHRQAAVSVWMEANGDISKLQGWEAGAKGEVFKRAAKDAQTLTPEEIAIANRAKAAFDVLAQRGQKFDVLKGGRENYVPHVWDLEKSKPAGFGNGRLQQDLKFAKARTFENFAAGDAAGFKPKSLAIGKLLPTYLHEMNKVIADRQFVQDLAEGKAEDGRPLVVPRGRISTIETESGGKAYLANPKATKLLQDAEGNPVNTMDYKTMPDQPALHDWRWEGKDEAGNPIYMKDDLAVHPDVLMRVNAMLGKSTLPIPKIISKASSVMKREMFGLLAPFHQVQEGTHAIAHRVNPFFGIEPVDMRQDKFMDAARHGLMLLPDRATSAGYMEGLGGKGSFLTQALRLFGESKAGENIAGKAATAMANVVDGYQNYLFHQYIPSLKFKTYESILERNREVYAKELKSGQMDESDVKLTSAEQANAAYGHLNRDLLDRQPNTQHLLELTLLAPDFLEARSRFVGQAAKGLLGSKVGAEQFKALAFMALVQAGTAYTLSKLMGDEYDPKNPFSVRHNGRSYTLRSVPEDLLRFGADIAAQAKGGDRGTPFISARINPLLQSLDQARTGLNYRGEKVSLKDTLEELLAKYIPITARSLPGIRQLTATSRQSPISPLEQLAGSFGLKISRASPITDTYAKASEWMEKTGVPKDKGSYPISKFQQLRYALEDGDMDKAQKELDKLRADAPGKDLESAFEKSLYHPFTKSNAMDAQFSQSLGATDKAVYDLAKTKRLEIAARFGRLR